jgi:hypothetical protein
MPNATPSPTRILIGTLRRRPDTPAVGSAEALRGLRDGLAAAAVMVDQTAPGRLQLPALSIRLRSSARSPQIAEAVRRAVDAAIQERRG